MTRLLRIKEASKILGVSESTLRRWDREGKLKPVRVGRFRRYDYDQLMEFLGKRKDNIVAVYARVSSRDQKEDLQRQIDYLVEVARKENPDSKVEVFSDIASGIKEGRKGLLRLIEHATLGKVRKVYVTYPDRLTRFGYDYFVEFFRALGVQVVAVNGKEFKEPEQELVEDLLAILTSFAGKLYGLRASAIKKAIKELKHASSEL